MGVFKVFKDLVGIEDVEDEIGEEEIQAAAAQIEKKSVDNKNSFTTPSSDLREAKLMPVQSSKPVVSGTTPFKMVVIEPKAFEECPKLVDNLKMKKPIIINLEKIETEAARKIFDFLSGATYALNGNVQKIANNIFVFAPENVDITGDTEGKGLEAITGSKGPWR